MSSIPSHWIKLATPSNALDNMVGRLVVRQEGEPVLDVIGLMQPVPSYHMSGPGVFRRILDVGFDPIDAKPHRRRFGSDPETKSAQVWATFEQGILTFVRRDGDGLNLGAPLEFELWISARWGRD